DVFDVHAVEQQSRGLQPLVVTRHAVLREQRPLLRRGGRRLRAAGDNGGDDERERTGEDEVSERFHQLAAAGFISFLRSAIELGLDRAGCVARKTPSAQTSAVRPSLSFASSFAPFETRNSMMSSEPRLAAPISAVTPIEFTSFTFIPRS